MKLVEQSVGSGTLERDGELRQQVRYSIDRYQGVMEGSGMPIPGLFRIEGSIDFGDTPDLTGWIDTPLVLRLEDGRALRVRLVDGAGRVLSEGHGPQKCMCC